MKNKILILFISDSSIYLTRFKIQKEFVNREGAPPSPVWSFRDNIKHLKK